MRNKKGILVLLALSLFCGCFTGCKKDKEDSKETKETTQTTVVSSTFSGTATKPTEMTSVSTYAPLYPQDGDTTPSYTTKSKSDESSVRVGIQQERLAADYD